MSRTTRPDDEIAVSRFRPIFKAAMAVGFVVLAVVSGAALSMAHPLAGAPLFFGLAAASLGFISVVCTKGVDREFTTGMAAWLGCTAAASAMMPLVCSSTDLFMMIVLFQAGIGMMAGLALLGALHVLWLLARTVYRGDMERARASARDARAAERPRWVTDSDRASSG